MVEKKKTVIQALREVYDEHGLGSAVFIAVFMAIPVFSMAIVLGIVTGFTGAMFEGWALMHLWQWFAVEQFGFQALTFWQAAGIVTIMTLLTQQYVASPKDTKWPILGGLLHSYLRPVITLFIGYVIHALFI